jgi:hypothetical protein
MTILLLSLLFGWFLASFTINLTNSFLIKFVHSVTWQLKVLSIIINGLFWIIVFYLIPYDLIIESINVYCSGDEEKNPYSLRLVSDHFGKSFTFDMRSVFDVTLLGFVGKTTVTAVKASPAPVKAAVAASTALSTGAVALGLKFSTYGVQKSRVYKLSKNEESVEIHISPNVIEGGTEKDVTDVCDNLKFYVDSPLEDPSILESIYNVLICMKVLSIICIFSFILYTLFIYVKFYGLESLKKHDNFIIKYVIKALHKSNSVYILIWGILTLFNLSWNLFFILRLLEIINNII